MTGSLSSLPNYVPDAFLLSPKTPFTPEDVVFGHFTFLPWARTGIASAVQAPAARHPGRGDGHRARRRWRGTGTGLAGSARTGAW